MGIHFSGVRRSGATAGALAFALCAVAGPGAAAGEGYVETPLRTVPFPAVTLRDAFWAPRLETNRTVTIPHVLRRLEEGGSLTGFARLAGDWSVKYRGWMWGDSDVYKTLEGMAYCLRTHPDPALEKRLEEIVATVVAAQAPDGYLMPHLQIAEPGYRHFSEEATRTTESYSIGHLIEAAVAHNEATGRLNFLNAAVRCADLLALVQRGGELEQISGHPEIELALVRLYRTATGDPIHRGLAARYVGSAGERASAWSGGRPFLAPGEARGHAVAACYLYCGATEVAAMSGDAGLDNRIDEKWESVVGRKLYITGGIGLPAGEAFGADHDLPNAGAYCETCAAIAFVLWNHRMFLWRDDARYIDVLERALYNGLLAGVGLSGDRFFYVNPLAVSGRSRPERVPWFGCPCCPVNAVRFLPQVPGLVYAVRREEVTVNLFAAGAAEVQVAGGKTTLRQETRYPWDGAVAIAVEPERPAAFAVRVRIPGWAQGRPVPGDLYRYAEDPGPRPPEVSLRVNGGAVPVRIERGYAVLRREWKAGDRIDLDLPMPARRVLAHEAVRADAGRAALERGPIVYCAEGADHGGRVLDLVLPDGAAITPRFRADLLGGVTVLEAGGLALSRQADGRVATRPAAIRAIPYHAWCHRGAGEMTVWLAREVAAATPPPPPRPDTIAGRARATASHCWPADTVDAVNDGILPASSHDLEPPRLTWWDHRGTSEWAQYDFREPAGVSAAEVYWFDDAGTGGCRVPASWRLLYRDGGRWAPVEATSSYGIEVDRFNRVTFRPVRTGGLRLEVQLRPGASGGILEWRVE